MERFVLSKYTNPSVYEILHIFHCQAHAHLESLTGNFQAAQVSGDRGFKYIAVFHRSLLPFSVLCSMPLSDILYSVDARSIRSRGAFINLRSSSVQTRTDVYYAIVLPICYVTLFTSLHRVERTLNFSIRGGREASSNIELIN